MAVRGPVHGSRGNPVESSSDAAAGKSAVATVLVMACTALSRLLGFARLAVIGAVFGASGEADVIHSVFSIPNNLRKLMAEGALSSAFVPVLSASLVEDESGSRAREIVHAVLMFQVVVLVPVVALAVVFAKPVVRVILDFPNPEKMALSVSLFRWLIAYLLFISVAAIIMGVLNSHHQFVIPAITPILFSICVIASVVLLHRRLGVFSMAVGVLLGGLLQVAFQVPAYRKAGYSVPLSMRFRDPDFRRVMKRWLPVVATASVFTINQQVAMRFASGLPDGSAAALGNALVFWQLPFGIFSASVTTVLFPQMSRQVAQSDTRGLVGSVNQGIRFLLVLLIPSSVVLALLGKELIAVALQRGAFSEAGTRLAARTLIGYSVGLFSVGAFSFLQRLYYAQGDYRTPFYAAVLVAVVDVGLSLWWKETVLRVAGLAYANSASFTVGLVVLAVVARARLGPLGGRSTLRTGGKVAGAAATGGVFVAWYLWVTGPWWADGSTFRALGLLLGAAAGYVAIVVGLYAALRVDVFMMLAKRWFRR